MGHARSCPYGLSGDNHDITIDPSQVEVSGPTGQVLPVSLVTVDEQGHLRYWDGGQWTEYRHS